MIPELEWCARTFDRPPPPHSVRTVCLDGAFTYVPLPATLYYYAAILSASMVLTPALALWFRRGGSERRVAAKEQKRSGLTALM